VRAIGPTLASAVLTKGAGFVFGHLGFFQDEVHLSVSDERKPLGFTREAEGPGLADVSHTAAHHFPHLDMQNLAHFVIIGMRIL